MVPEKAIAMMPSQALHLWLSRRRAAPGFKPGSGLDVELGMQQKPGEGYVADMAEEGEPLLIDDAEDERLRPAQCRRRCRQRHSAGDQRADGPATPG